MEKEENYSVNFTGLADYNSHQHQHHQEHVMKPRIGGETAADRNIGMIDYMLNNNPHQQQQHHISSAGFSTSTSFDKLSFADVMQFADFGPKLALNQTKIPEEEIGIDPAGYFLRFPVLNDKLDQDHQDHHQQPLMVPPPSGFDDNEERLLFKGSASVENNNNRAGVLMEGRENTEDEDEEEDARASDNAAVQLRFLGDHDMQIQSSQCPMAPLPEANKTKRKRPRTIKTSEEVESQRMTHIAVERNRRKQMNEHLRVLRSLMPGSYVQRGDQASIIGGAIEFVRELEQLLQCLESQKRRRMLGECPRQIEELSTSSNMGIMQQTAQVQLFPGASLPPIQQAQNNDQMKQLVDLDTGLREETAENKSCLADVEVKLLGFDAMIKILSRRRPGQLVKTIAALEDLQLNVLHTNITTIEQTVLYSFNVKVASESRFTAEDIATSVQQIFSFIHANSTM